MTDKPPTSEIQRAFGAESRSQMLAEYFAGAGEVTPANAWLHVYRLLLWIDRTTGLAHCYESDKAQPGRPWYARSLAFHDWVSKALGTGPAELAAIVDHLFRTGTIRLAKVMVRQGHDRALLAAEQRRPYEGRGFPEPGDNPELEALIRGELGEWFSREPSPEAMRRLTQRVGTFLGQENKRKNLVGEGFEDVLGAIVNRLAGASALGVHTRAVLDSLPGFRTPRESEKPRKVDLAVIGPGDRRILASVKWSVRADREEQFGVDFDTYARLEDLGRNFDFVLVTNEFDAARLVAACERRSQNASLFSAVVHVNPQGVLAAYGDKVRSSAKWLVDHVNSGRLSSLQQWLETIVA